MGPKLESEGVFKVYDELCDFSEVIRAGGMSRGRHFSGYGLRARCGDKEFRVEGDCYGFNNGRRLAGLN